ncbi:desmocollin-3-like [Scleropages formosus]|uniref:Desmocollin-3-like n=1 Tax=Scleropages formosus TaxID=113540 RepID=A0A8C9TTT0_SCLFO|nr:desmocollin-3-like [Scleropages formosus]
MDRGSLVLLLCAFSLVLSKCAESCLPRSIQAAVPQKIMSGDIVYKVDLTRCGTQVLPVKTSDPDFDMQSDGTINTLRVTTIPVSGRMFSVWLQDPAGHSEKLNVRLSPEIPGQSQFPVPSSGARKRYKRRWSPLPFQITENDSPPFPKEIEMIGSDSSVNHSVYYIISGPGVTQEPLGLFSLDTNTALLRVHRPVDREQISQFKLLVKVFDKDTEEETDLPLTVTVNVKDVNDNAPEFSGPLQFSVLEQSRPGTVVGKVNATDRDDPQTLHAKIAYSLLSGGDAFVIDPGTGVIATRTGTLDREVKDTHLLVVQIKDMNGAWNGRSNTATATVTLQDINDNPPAFARPSFRARVEENQPDGLILRIPVEDRDLAGTPSWRALFFITRGNEDGNFRIERDAKTNEGLLLVTKALDYEKTSKVSLMVQAQNEVDLKGTTASWLSVPVDVEVLDVDEGPEFLVQNLYLTIEENTAAGTVIGTYTATDPETRSSRGIRYHKLSDPALWIDVSEVTGELRVAGAVDRESPFVERDLYNITVRAVDSSSKSATGTVVIHIEDKNDNTPHIPQKSLTLCKTDGGLGSVVVTAEDKDDFPFAEPFTFELADRHDDSWTIIRLNGTAALLQEAKELPVGNYTVPLFVRDQQSLGAEQMVTVRVCHCADGECLPPRRSVALGLWGLLAALLGLVLLVLFCVCFSLVCVTKPEKAFIKDSQDGAGILLQSNTEGPGEAVDAAVLVSPAAPEQSAKGSVSDGRGQHILGARAEQSMQQHADGLALGDSLGQRTVAHYGSGLRALDERRFRFIDRSLNAIWETNGLYINKKLSDFTAEGDGHLADDVLHSYGFEGRGSPAGSVGCCSDFGDDRGLDFADTLGDKFKALAEVCAPK